MFEAWIHRLPSRLHLFIATAISLMAAAAFGVALGEGDLFKVYLWLLGAGATALMMMLGDKYWMLIPFAYVCDLPAVPFRGKVIEMTEIAAALCSVVFFIRYALRKQSLTLFRGIHLPVLLYAGWVAFIFLKNPVGLSGFGAGEGGARDYAKLAMGFAVFVIVANQKIGERECKWILIMILGGSFIGTAKEIFIFFHPIERGVMAGGAGSPGDYYSWHQALANIPMIAFLLLFSRYPAREIFSLRSMWMLPVFAVCVIIILLSGKRSAVGVLPLWAIAAAFYRKEWGFVFLWIAGAVVAGSIVVVGHGTLFHLPLVAQRAVSWLPGQWDAALQGYEGGGDDFRKMLRLLASEKIKLDPWVGTGYKMDMSLMYRIQSSGLGGMEEQVAPFAMGSAWHNTWLGYAADFGIPASILVGVIYATYLTFGFRIFRRAPAGSFAQILAMYILLFTTRDIAFSHVSGHSARDAFSRWWLYGTLVSISLGLQSRALLGENESRQESPRNAEAGPASRERRARRPVIVPTVH